MSKRIEKRENFKYKAAYLPLLSAIKATAMPAAEGVPGGGGGGGLELKLDVGCAQIRARTQAQRRELGP